MMLFDDFLSFYKKKGYFPLGIYTPQKKLNEKQLKRKYTKYLDVYNRLKFPKRKSHIKDHVTKETCMNNAGKTCEIWKVLTKYERDIVYPRLFGELKILDPMHIVSRRYKNLRNDPDNIIIGMRYFHSYIDQHIDPITLKPMSSEKRNEWFIRVIGKERFKRLMKKKENK